MDTSDGGGPGSKQRDMHHASDALMVGENSIIPDAGSATIVFSFKAVEIRCLGKTTPAAFARSQEKGCSTLFQMILFLFP